MTQIGTAMKVQAMACARGEPATAVTEERRLSEMPSIHVTASPLAFRTPLCRLSRNGQASGQRTYLIQRHFIRNWQMHNE